VVSGWSSSKQNLPHRFMLESPVSHFFITNSCTWNRSKALPHAEQHHGLAILGENQEVHQFVNRLVHLFGTYLLSSLSFLPLYQVNQVFLYHPQTQKSPVITLQARQAGKWNMPPEHRHFVPDIRALTERVDSTTGLLLLGLFHRSVRVAYGEL
jgi:hypothetical protein